MRNWHGLTNAAARKLDQRTAQILKDEGIEPYLDYITRFKNEETNEVFTTTGLRENWVFCETARARAKDWAQQFDAFKVTAVLTNLRHCVIRLRGPDVKLGGLEAQIRLLTRAYDRAVETLKRNGSIDPIGVAIHIRFDYEKNLWDVHAHCLWIIHSHNLRKIDAYLERHFKSFWRGLSKNSPGATANYIAVNLIKHPEMKNWPKEAVSELGRLTRCRLLRAAGQFRRYRREIKDQKLSRIGDAIIIEPRSRRIESKVHGGSTARPPSDRFFYKKWNGKIALTSVSRVHRDNLKDAKPRATKTVCMDRSTGSIPAAAQESLGSLVSSSGTSALRTHPLVALRLRRLARCPASRAGMRMSKIRRDIALMIALRRSVRAFMRRLSPSEERLKSARGGLKAAAGAQAARAGS